ncbi:hypothetical protein KBZ15_01320 [Cyanobium sp. BA20m-p-22]|uniref:hypothetical protein n=1 Tax=Cyanobium sp. BA20m-p-22 TaxID=2823704 RepID=UPI0020CCBB2A|nr:hypothetical protein [Cyanobium sp. BA20m-p-22]MCP9908558.1 hypothetical protein [Cyanobium sp. BA20m-p-22]
MALTTLPLGQRDLRYPHWEFSDPTSGDRLRGVPELGGLISGWRCGDREGVRPDRQLIHQPKRGHYRRLGQHDRDLRRAGALLSYCPTWGRPGVKRRWPKQVGAIGFPLPRALQLVEH